MNIPRMYTESLKMFGYTEEEARFLYLVATHSGYFTCQQFLKFVNGKPGKRSLSFARKTLEKKHATSKEYLRNGRVYHLFSRNLYEAIGRDNLRFRRVHSTEYIRTRLAALDFILGKPQYVYLETEAQKVQYFSEQLGIDKKYLPAKRYAGAIKDRFSDRYFVDKLPMFYRPNSSPLPVVFFTFIDPGLESLDSFETHLRAYLPLFLQLPKVNFYYVATRERNFERARRFFFSVFERHWDCDSRQGLLDYFRRRRTWDSKEFGKLSNQDLIFLNESKMKFSSQAIEDIYQRWKAGELTDQGVRSGFQKVRTPREVSFTTTVVNGQAALFERHPHPKVKTDRKSSDPAPFSGGFTSGFTPASR